MSFLSKNEFVLTTEIYSPQTLLDSIRHFSEYLDAQISTTYSDKANKLIINIKDASKSKASEIKGELLNYILGCSISSKINE